MDATQQSFGDPQDLNFLEQQPQSQDKLQETTGHK